MSKLIYLDHAAATPISKEALEAMQPYFSERFYNPSATYFAAKVVADELKKARSKVAHWLAVKPSEIIFTAGGTEANNLALLGVLSEFKNAHIVASAIEHDSILEPLAKLKKQGHKISLVRPDKTGLISATDLAESVNDKTVLVSIMYANNEIGTIQPIKRIADELNKIRAKRAQNGNKTPLYFHSDACQAANYLSLQAHRLGVDLMTINAGKIYGPKQTGALFVASHVKLDPLILGGGQERGLRSGTENVANYIGFAKALNIAQTIRETESPRLLKLQQFFIASMLTKIPKAKINGSLKGRLPNNVHVTFRGNDNERLMMQLEEQGILCGLGSACSASSEEPSHVLKACGLSDQEAQSSLRFTMGRSTSLKDIKQVINSLATLVR